MKSVIFTTQFKKDYKKALKQHRKIEEFRKVLEVLVAGERLDTKYKEHKLIGNYKGTLECHIAPDWLLIYRVTSDSVELVRMGSHSELFI